MDRLAGTVQTFPVVVRDGKAYGRLILTCGDRVIRIIAEGDQDLIEQVYATARGDYQASPSTAAPAAPYNAAVDGDLEAACRVLIGYARRGNLAAIQRIRLLQDGACLGNADCIAVVDAICALLAREPDLQC